ncbi:MAG: type I phosphomannose isomerase catalytic subunit [Planctomycetota bacterium]|nr:type I phosphomannose isomerase catalytic subunit [Planctomycetota bacterium]
MPKSLQPRSLREPLRFERICLEKVWGGRRLERAVGMTLPGTGPIGETWELVDRSDYVSVVSSGTWKGATLTELVHDSPRELMGSAKLTPEGRFPLIVKFLDASEPLSVQVHPPSGTRGPLGEGKSEAWYILDAEHESKLWIGLKPGTTREHLAATASKRDVLEHVLEWPARRGDIAFIPGGTVHAIGGGITLLEVQENADTTHRLYDWDRAGLDGKPRALQPSESIASTDVNASPKPHAAQFEALDAHTRCAGLVSAPCFAMDLYEIDGHRAFDTNDLALIYVVLQGRGSLVVNDKNGRSLVSSDKTRSASVIATGDLWLVPASVGPHTISAHDGSLKVMRVATRA